MELEQQNTSVHHQPPSPTTTTISNENLLSLQNDKINLNELGKPVSESNSLETQLEQPPVEDEIAPADVADVEKPGGELTDSVADVEKPGGELTDSVAGADVAGLEKSGDELIDSAAVSDVAGMEKDADGCELTHSVADVEKHDGGADLTDSVAGDDVAGVEKHDGGDELTDSVAGDDVAGVETHDGGSCDMLTDSVTVVGEPEEVMTDFKAIENFEMEENVKMEEGVGVREGVTENEEKEKMDRHLESDDAETMSDDDDDDEEEKVERKLPVKRRGRPPGKGKKGLKSPKATPKSTGRVKMVKEEEEDVCFICYDGGDLVLCDMRNCPKAYHISCTDRDAAFFQSKGKWNCGWHLCTTCVKKAEYMCYTCSFSLCKTCIKSNVILCIREKEKKGFCKTCMKTIMAIEKNVQEDQGIIDFDDKNSWEYLFKGYWLDKKTKLNISLDELVEAKNAWKEPDPASKPDPPAAGHSDGGSGSEHPSENLESQTTKTRRRKSKKQKTHDSAVTASEGTSVPENTEWASKELLEFVMHMGCDKSSQSQFDVQALLLEYIKINKLRDARRKSQIICDARLQSLFGKPRVGHFEMLKLLESHFLIKEDDDVKGNVVDTELGPADDDDTETVAKGSKDKKRKIRKKGDREPQSNREDFAAIDNHNINLIYLKRKLAEDLLDDVESFNSKVVGTFVRIRITGANQKNDLYRLVQVTGTIKEEPYAVGKKMTDTMLEILNLDKKEYITIDSISNQDFMEDECQRLRQSIKCGLINRLTVGDILDKAIELQATRVNDWLETEVLRLSHLRDRASDLGRKKELRECVEKLQVLKTPEERTRRIQDIPVVHDDPTMDPNYESEDNADEDSKKQDIYKNTVSSSQRRDYPSKESGRGMGTSRSSGKNYQLSRNLSSNNFSNKVEDVTSPRLAPHNENRWDQGRDRSTQPSSVIIPSSINEREKIVASTEDISESGLKANETEKQWHYKDPTGKIQGPFSMAQLRKWNNSNFFPADLKIWRKSEKEDDGILLTGALEGQLHVKIPKPSSNDRHGFANLPSPTPNQSLGHVGSPVGPKTLVQTGHMVSTPVINMPPQMVQSLAGQNPHSWVGGPTHNPQPSPVVGQQLTYNQWVGGPNTAQSSAGNFLQQPLPPTQPTDSWPIVPQNPTMGLSGITTASKSMNWGSSQLTGNVDPSWGLQSGSGSVHPGWAPTQPAQAVTPNQGRVTGAGSGPTQGPIVSGIGNSSWGGPSFNPSEAASAGNQLPGLVGPYQSSGSGNSNQGWGSPTSRNRSRWDGNERHQPYNKSGDSGDKWSRDSRGGGSNSRDNIRHYDESRLFNSRGNSRDSDRYYKH